MNFIEFAPLDMKNTFNMTEPHSHDFYEFYFLLDGKREFFLENKMFSLDKNTLVVIPPFVIHKTEGGPYKRINVNISGNYFSAYEKTIVEQLLNTTVVLINDADKPFLYKLLNEGIKAQVNNLPNKNEIMAAYFHALIVYLGETELKSGVESAELNVRSYSADILKIVKYLNNNFANKLSLQDIADSFFISRTKLCTEFKKTMNCSVNEYITTLRITEAKKMLDDTNKSMDQIAYECGFSSASYFGLIFKKETGKAPSYFRKR